MCNNGRYLRMRLLGLRLRGSCVAAVAAVRAVAAITAALAAAAIAAAIAAVVTAAAVAAAVATVAAIAASIAAVCAWTAFCSSWPWDAAGCAECRFKRRRAGACRRHIRWQQSELAGYQ